MNTPLVNQKIKHPMKCTFLQDVTLARGTIDFMENSIEIGWLRQLKKSNS